MPPALRSIARAASLTLALFLFSFVTASAEPLAIVAAVKGHVTVTASRGGPATRATFGQALERGDRIAVPAGGAASIYFHDGTAVELTENSSLTIGGRGTPKPRAGGAPGLPGEVYASVQRFVSGGSRESGLVALSALRGIDDRQAPVLLEPRRTNLLEARPAFRWRAVTGARRYRVSLSGDAGELWARETADTTLDYPADAGPLPAGGDFLWEVRALGESGELRREDSYFRRLPESEATAVQAALRGIQDSAGGPDTPAACYLAGSYLCDRGLFRDATARFAALARLSPDSPAPHEALGNVFRAVGLTDLAAAEYRQALRSAREP